MTCYKKHEKKTEISDVVAAIVKNRHFFDVFSENYENSQAKNPVDGKKKSQKSIFFSHFLEIWENRIFHWEWANRREKMSHFCDFLTYQKKNVITLTISNQFWIKKIAPGSSRRDLTN